MFLVGVLSSGMGRRDEFFTLYTSLHRGANFVLVNTYVNVYDVYDFKLFNSYVQRYWCTLMSYDTFLV